MKLYALIPLVTLLASPSHAMEEREKEQHNHSHASFKSSGMTPPVSPFSSRMEYIKSIYPLDNPKELAITVGLTAVLSPCLCFFWAQETCCPRNNASTNTSDHEHKS